MVSIQGYRDAIQSHGTSGLVRTDRHLQDVKTFATRPFVGKIAAWINNPKDGNDLFLSNKDTKRQFLDAVDKEFGPAFRAQAEGMVYADGKSSKPLSLRVVKQVIDEGDRIKRDPVLKQKLGIEHLASKLAGSHFLIGSDIAHSATRHGLDLHLDDMARHSLGITTDTLSSTDALRVAGRKSELLNELVFPKLHEHVKAAVIVAGQEGRASVERLPGGDARIGGIPLSDVVRLGIEQSGVYRGKAAIMNAIDTLPLPADTKVALKRLALAGNHDNVAAFMQHADTLTGGSWSAAKAEAKVVIQVAGDNRKEARMEQDCSDILENLSNVLDRLGPDAAKAAITNEMQRLTDGNHKVELYNIRNMTTELTRWLPEQFDDLRPLIAEMRRIAT